MRLLALSPTYQRSLLRDMSRFLLLFLVGIEAIYLSDKLLTDLLLAAMNYGHGAGFLLRSTALATPEILLLGLPLALTMTVFLVLLQRRETGDFVALAQIGFAPRTVIGLSLGLGGLGCAAALAIGGVLAPLAEYRLGLMLHQARYAVLTSGNPGIRNVINLDGATILYHRLAPDDAVSARVFLHLPIGAGAFRVITARDSQVRFDTPDDDGVLGLTGAQVTGFSTTEPPGLRRDMAVSTGRMVYHTDIFAVPQFQPRESAASTLTLPELLAPPAGLERPAQEAALQIILAAMLAFLSPLVAATAMGLTRRALVPLAGPVGVGLVLAGGFAIAPAADWLVRFGLWESIGLALAGGIALASLLSLVLALLGDALLAPAQVRL
jgi:lipopolysaccharide export LptBFGC system permease protein LptF